MQQVSIPHTPLRPSAICLGAAGWGSAVKQDDAQRLFDTFRAAGGNFFDTAHVYAAWIKDGAGLSERALGACVRHVGARAGVVIASKGGHPDFKPNYPRPDAFLSPEVIQRDIADSLERLGTGYIDLYYLHRDDTRVPVGEIIDVLDAEACAGRIRYPAASNWSTQRMAAANDYAATHGKLRLAASQVQWSLPVPRWEIKADPTTRYLTPADEAWHAASGVPVIPYSVTADGYIASGGARGKGYDTPDNHARLERAQKLAAELKCTPGQIAIAWLINHPFPVIPVTGTSNAEHLADTIGALDVKLTAEQVRWLREG